MTEVEAPPGQGNHGAVGRRPIEDGDLDFLYRLYASTREDELSVTPWSAEEKETFLRMQFRAQHEHYQAHFPAAEYSLLLREGQPVGRLYVDRRPDEIRLIDIALVPAARNEGLGGALLRELMAEAEGGAKPLRIHVEQFNPARRLYDRLGFRKIEDQGVYHLMEWSGPSSPE